MFGFYPLLKMINCSLCVRPLGTLEAEKKKSPGGAGTFLYLICFPRLRAGELCEAEETISNNKIEYTS